VLAAFDLKLAAFTIGSRISFSGEIVDAVSRSPYWSSTAIFIEENDP
jgi:hypothetical protein